ncbi:hypothetical protein LTR94_029201, partial [Friedmanniomyces endolithicus]
RDHARTGPGRPDRRAGTAGDRPVEEGAVRRPARGQGHLHLGPARTRQVHADGPLLFLDARAEEGPRSLPRLHGAHPRPGEAVARRHAAQPQGRVRNQQGRRPHSADRGPDRLGGAPAVLRRTAGDGHRRRHDPGPAVRGPVREEGGAGRHLEPRARRPLQERHQPPALPALHRHHPPALRRGRDGGRPRLPPGPHGRGQGLVLAVGRRGAARLRDPVVRPQGRRAGRTHRPAGAGPRGEAGAHGRRHGARDLQRAVRPPLGAAGLSRRRPA